MKQWLVLPALAALLLLLTGCEAVFQTMEYGEIISPRLEAVQYQDGVGLRLSGRCARSGYVVEKIKQVKSGGELQLLVFVSPLERDARPKTFQADLLLDGIDVVTFGAHREVLWRRRPPPVPEKPKQQFLPPEP